MDSKPLDRLREKGLTVGLRCGKLHVGPPGEIDEVLDETIRAHRHEIRTALRLEEAGEGLDLARVDPATGKPALPLDEEATERQAERLRQLAEDPAFGGRRAAVLEIVDEALEGGLTRAGAYELILDLGRRIRERTEDEEGRDRATAGGMCEDCGGAIGPSATICGRCRRIQQGLPVRAESTRTHRGEPPVE